MRALKTVLPGILILEPKVFEDDRGHFFESFNQREIQRLTGFEGAFVQDNQSTSHRNVLRGLHYQIQHAQGKLVRVVAGEAFDVAVDLRRSAPTFGKWIGVYLSAENKRMCWIPPGFAHGFLVTSESCAFLYKTTDYWSPGDERCIRWNDECLGIDWPLQAAPVVSCKDANAVSLAEADTFP
jgi:dTDP-4-dehydrorhamnose 3,5-epimerase